MGISILQGSSNGTEIYKEIFHPNPETNANGLVTLEIGGGIPLTGTFSIIDWSNGPYFIKTETDPTGGTNYTLTGTSQLLSVPYALHAKTADGADESDPLFTSWDKSTGISITESQISDIGNYIETETDPVFSAWDKSTGISINESQISNLQPYLTSEADPTVPAHVKGITNSNLESWNEAHGWGNHSGLYRPVSWRPSWTDVTNKPTAFIPSVHSHSIGDITSGTLNIERIPTGTTSSTVSLGNHNHGNITNNGRIGIAANRLVMTGTGGTLTAREGYAVGEMLYWNGSAWVTVSPGSAGQVLTIINDAPQWATLLGAVIGSSTDVYNPVTGRIWMDRNLGALQVADSSNDVNAYGYLYQWGRGNDGHQLRTSPTTSILSSSPTPGHHYFIIPNVEPYDWISPQNDELWQGVDGLNNPCPDGYRLPSEAEWNAEIQSWSSNDAAGAFASPLKLPMAGFRYSNDPDAEGIGGFYKSSTVNGIYYRGFSFTNNSNDIVIGNGTRAFGHSVRCIKD